MDVWDHFLAGVDVEKDGKHEMYTILLGLRKMKNEADHQIRAINIKDANFARATLLTDNGGGHAIYSGSEFASSKKIISQTGAESQENSSKEQKSVRDTKQAQSYSGGKIYSKTVPVGNVAWIDPTQGQYAEVEQYAVRDNGDRTEDNLNALKRERVDIEEQLDLAYVNDLSDAEIRKLENRLTKVEADIDKIVAEERKASVLTPMQTIIDNLQNYRMTDLYSLAEQVSEGAWDGYEELSRIDLEDSLREVIEERELSPLEMQSKKFGLYVRPVSQNQIRESNTMLP